MFICSLTEDMVIKKTSGLFGLFSPKKKKKKKSFNNCSKYLHDVYKDFSFPRLNKKLKQNIILTFFENRFFECMLFSRIIPWKKLIKILLFFFFFNFFFFFFSFENRKLVSKSRNQTVMIVSINDQEGQHCPCQVCSDITIKNLYVNCNISLIIFGMT